MLVVVPQVEQGVLGAPRPHRVNQIAVDGAREAVDQVGDPAAHAALVAVADAADAVEVVVVIVVL